MGGGYGGNQPMNPMGGGGFAANNSMMGAGMNNARASPMGQFDAFSGLGATQGGAGRGGNNQYGGRGQMGQQPRR
jgi:hypothetical protein